ncbi:MAG TPA: HAD family hydrolase [Tepidisphaeraceae bacterium]|jgi:putative hydrolase of the HAD superfamily|nr:HAD family hydrolase [Tepidisphaeraceae bacterium]
MLAKMPAPRAVLFDLDETLTDRTRSIERFAPEFAERFGFDLNGSEPDEIYRCILAGDGGGYASREDFCSHLQSSLRWRRVPSQNELLSFWRDRFPRCCIGRDGVASTLQALHRRGLKLGVITNGMTLSQNTKLDVLGIRPLLSVVVISEEVGIRKPDPRIFQMALDKLGVLAAETMFVGDNPLLDVAASRAVGLRGIWLNPRGDPPPQNGSCPESVAAVEQIIDLLNPSAE